jgi:hypothetical protein
MLREDIHREFSKTGYCSLLHRLHEIGYDFVFIDEIESEKSPLFLRHDIDLCLERAAEIAKIESKEGVKSTYYILLNTEFYNVHSRRNRQALEDIMAHGHRIGLHFDAVGYPDGQESFENAVAQECSVLENLIGMPVESISFHRPAPWLQGRQGTIAGRAHAYEPRFFTSLAYFADSQGAWRFGHPLDDARVLAAKALQLVIHPIWWTEDRGGVLEKLDAFRKWKGNRLRHEMALNIKPFAESFGPDGGLAPPV